MFICKSDLKYDTRSIAYLRQSALRDFIILTLYEQKGNQGIILDDIFSQTQAKYSEIKDMIEELCIQNQNKDGELEFIQYPDSKVKLEQSNLREINEKWAQLAKEVEKCKQENFYKNIENEQF